MADGQEAALELGRFLRNRRERIRPEEVGFPAGGRRRTPGLRREEVAVLAGLSTTWYTYLEQGRGRDVSSSVLDSIARVLRLSEDERRYMHFLTFGHVASSNPLGEESSIDDWLRQIVSIAEEHPYPVYLTNRATDLIAWNRAAAEWYDDWDRLPVRDRNFLQWLLTEDKAKRRFVNWEMVARDVVARWRIDVAQWPHNPLIQDRTSDLREKSPEFALWWDNQGVLEHRTGVRTMRHPHLGVKDWLVVPLISFYEQSPGIIYHLPGGASKQR